MKARVKATGEIVDIIRNSAFDKNVFYDSNGQKYNREELSFDVKEKSFPKDDDYWTRLEHQAAIAAMQSYVSNNVYLREIRGMCKEPQEMRDLIADLSILLATTLVQKLKEKEERK